MGRGIAQRLALIVRRGDDSTAVNDNLADGNLTFVECLPGFGERHPHPAVVGKKGIEGIWDFGFGISDLYTFGSSQWPVVRPLPSGLPFARARQPDHDHTGSRQWSVVFLTLSSSGVSLRAAMSAKYPAFVKRDLDGFFGLLIDNLVQLLLIPMMCADACGMTGE